MLSSSSLALFLPILILTTSSTASPQFKQAPKFHNAPRCTTTTTTINTSNDTSSNTVHIVMTLDITYLRGSIAAIFSILTHTSCPDNIHFHFITTNQNHNHKAVSVVSNTFTYLVYNTYIINTVSLTGLISNSIRFALDTPLNYARIYLPNILPTSISKVVYLDSDLILIDDIAELAKTELKNDQVIAAPEHCNANFTSYFTPSFWANPTLSLTFSGRKPCYFNTGVMVIDLVKWRSGDYTRRMVEWMEVQKRMRIYELGSLPPFLLVFGGEVTSVDQRWNQHGLGGDNYRGVCRGLHPGRVSLLHWSGKGKPWTRIDDGCMCPVDMVWARYDLILHGTKSNGLNFN